MTDEQRLFAVRGAAQADENSREAILAATEELVGELLSRNEVTPAGAVSCIFTVTDDLTEEFPAVAARGLGFEAVPLLCAREMNVPGAMPRVIRVLMHYYAPTGHEPEHVYLGAARELRADLHSAQ
jgi:chorismate mutase